MSVFMLSMLMFALMAYVLYQMINFKKTIDDHKEKVEKLTGLVNKQQNETRSLLTAYMSESRAISFYEDVSSLIKDKEVSDLFTSLAKDEEKHMMLLEKCLKKNMN